MLSDYDDDFQLSDDSDDDFENSVANKAVKTKAPAKKASTAAKSKSAATKKRPAEPMDSTLEPPAKKSPVKKGGKKVTEYQKVTQLEHILLRPDTYIGSIESRTEPLWVYDEVEGMQYRDITYVPGLYKIFDEVLVNAADNFQRCSTMTSIKVEINAEDNLISVYNDGDGIPIKIHEKEKVYIPDLIFGTLLTSSNFNDSERKVTGGRNGYGAKLCNIYSTEFIVETADMDVGKKFKQVYRGNMMKRGEPKITPLPASTKNEYVKISFKPDLQRFKMDVLDKDIVALLSKRVYDVAGCNPTLKVFLNGKRIPVNNFKQYVELYTKSDPSLKVVHEDVSDRWSIAIACSEGEFKQCSFVNSIATTRGGSHVEHVSKSVIKAIVDHISKKNKKDTSSVKPAQVRSHMWIFVRALIENPAFDSQTKETLTSKVSQFGSKCSPSEAFLKKVCKETGIVQATTAYAQFKAQKNLSKKDGKKKTRLTGIPKLDDANDAGTKNAHLCTLILTEGDSAKTLAVTGLGIVGRDRYGVFPLRGKMLNVRDASAKSIMENKEVTYLKAILGLKQGVNYADDKNFKTLRYGHLMIMTDQDQDGSHIKGLLINMLDRFWGELLRRPGFLVEFITPIVKAKKKGKSKESHNFYTIPEYEKWKEENNNGRGYQIRYYKGLGTSTREEAKEYFKALERHKIKFKTTPEDKNLIDQAFSKKRAEDRKTWMRQFEPGTYLDQNVKAISYADFINKELILFSLSDCVRSIPSVMDGLKPGQRKILFSCFKRNLTKEIKVAQLGGYVSENSAYHHGEQSLYATIVNMAQNFVGSNNINLLFPSGQFGSRLHGGKDSASPRYIFTKLNKITRYLFPEQDEKILHFLEDDGDSIEPEWYIPVIPTALVNGADGIGTGWSTSVPNFNPLDLIANVKRFLKKEELEPMTPWYRGFCGEISPDTSKEGSYTCSGVYDVDEDDYVISVTELPVGVWTQNYKDFLEGMMVDTDADKGIITELREYHSDTSVDFRITFTPQGYKHVMSDIGKYLKLQTTINTSNMHFFDAKGRIERYLTPEDVVREYGDIRLEAYRKRKDFFINLWRAELEKLSNQARFILAIVKDEMKIRNVPRKKVIAQLEKDGYDKFTKGKSVKKIKKESDLSEEEEEDNEGEKETASGYEYLLSMPLLSLTEEKVRKLLSQRDAKEEDLNTLLKKSPEDLWNEDLDSLETAYKEFLAAYDKEVEGDRKELDKSGRPKTPRKRLIPVKHETTSKVKKSSSSSDIEKKSSGGAKGGSSKASAGTKKSSTSADAKVADTKTSLLSKYFKIAEEAMEDIEEDEEPAYDCSDFDNLTGDFTEGNSSVAEKEEKAPPQRKRNILMDLDLSDDDELEESAPAKKAVTKKALNKAAKAPATAPKKKSKVMQLSDEEGSDFEDENVFDVFKKPAAKKAAPVKAAPAKKAPAKKAPAKKAPAKKITKKSLLSLSSEEEGEESEFELEEELSEAGDDAEETPSPPKKAAAPAKKKPTAAKAKAAPAEKTRKRAAPVKAAGKPPKKTMKLSSESDDDSFNVTDEEDIPVVKKSATARPSRRQVAKPKSYALSDDSDSDFGL